MPFSTRCMVDERPAARTGCCCLAFPMGQCWRFMSAPRRGGCSGWRCSIRRVACCHPEAERTKSFVALRCCWCMVMADDWSSHQQSLPQARRDAARSGWTDVFCPYNEVQATGRPRGLSVALAFYAQTNWVFDLTPCGGLVCAQGDPCDASPFAVTMPVTFIRPNPLLATLL